MSLPSGLLFYLDYTYGTNVGGLVPSGTNYGGRLYTEGRSIYNNPPGKGIQSGSLAVGGQYDLVGSGYSRVTATQAIADIFEDTKAFVYAGGSSMVLHGAGGFAATAHTTGTDGKLLQFDPQITNLIESDGGKFFFLAIPFTAGNLPDVD